jgi:hypothetical protein
VLAITVDLTEVEHLARSLPTLQTALDRGLRAGLEESLSFLETKAKATARARDVVGVSGRYMNAIKHTGPFGEAASLWGEVFSDVAWRDYVEWGRAPGKMPPEDAILLWVQRKLQVDEERLASVTFLVRRKIAREGTIKRFQKSPGQPAGAEVMTTTFEEGFQPVCAIFDRHVSQAIQEWARAQV